MGSEPPAPLITNVNMTNTLLKFERLEHSRIFFYGANSLHLKVFLSVIRTKYFPQATNSIDIIC